MRAAAVSLVDAVLFGLAAWRWGPTPAAVAGGALFASLLVMSVVDLDHRRIPDRLTGPLAGLTAAATVAASWWTGRWSLLLGAMTGAAVFSGALGLVHLVAPGGLGRGDVKLAPSLGAALGWQADSPAGAVAAVLAALAGAAALGVVVGLALLVVRRRNEPYPFGPALAAATIVGLLAGRS